MTTLGPEGAGDPGFRFTASFNLPGGTQRITASETAQEGSTAWR
jgi:hypothetical protein